MAVIDRMNKRLGADKIKLGSMDIQRTWKNEPKNLSPCRSTDINHLFKSKSNITFFNKFSNFLN